MNKTKEFKLTGEQWSLRLSIEVCNPTGWKDINDYQTTYITKETFCNLAANSVLIPPSQKNRAEVKRFRELINHSW